MYASVLQLLYCTTIVLSFTINIRSGTVGIVSKTQIPLQLQPMVITCRLTDIVTISAPTIADRKAYYYLTNPQGAVTKLNIDTPKNAQKQANFETIDVKSDKVKVLAPINDYKSFNINFGHFPNETKDIFAVKEAKMEANEFMIGPVSEEDYGKWMFSAVYEDDEGEFIELYNVINLDITEMVPGKPRRKRLLTGETFKLSFAYPIQNLESCRLIAPETSHRFYNRRRTKPDRCGYEVRNVSLADTGVWDIIGVGRITYHAVVALRVVDERYPNPARTLFQFPLVY